MSDLKNYHAVIFGRSTTLQLSDRDAELRGLGAQNLVGAELPAPPSAFEPPAVTDPEAAEAARVAAELADFKDREAAAAANAAEAEKKKKAAAAPANKSRAASTKTEK